MIEFLNSNAEILARIQFAFTVSFHIVFPAFTIGLASFLAVIEYKYLKTRDLAYKEIYKMWIKIFAVCFGMGVVSGVVMSYQFGTNWGLFSDKVGNVIGPLLGYEVLTAFFLEASFLGIMLFGWGRVSQRMHFISTCIVAVGTLISAFWILSANSWMQTPQGFEIREDGLFYPTSWMEIIFNPSFPYRLIHMIIAAYLTTAFVIGGVSAFYLLKGKFVNTAKKTFFMAMLMAVFVAPIQLFVGDYHGLNTLKHQPAKVAAMEGVWEDEKGADLRIFAIPDQENQKNHYEVKIPKLASLILTHKLDGEIKGLKSFPDEQPPVAIVFWSFRIMVAIGLAMIVTGIIAIFLYFKKRLYDSRPFLYWCMLLTPSGFIAVLAGWFVTEVGRQPYTVYGVMKTADSLSPVVGTQISISLAIFIIVYTFIFGAGSYYILKLIKKGPVIADDKEEFYDHSKQASFTKSITK
ncbi:cytochrome ubiquinol oxidase subunit I [Rickettsiales bacterium]|nr:cytochrome ubiquinol oxidase subunit I [Rickettsiales bacterium]